MSQRKIPVNLTESEWRKVIYILDALSGYTDLADSIEEQIIENKRKKSSYETGRICNA